MFNFNLDIVNTTKNNNYNNPNNSNDPVHTNVNNIMIITIVNDSNFNRLSNILSNVSNQTCSNYDLHIINNNCNRYNTFQLKILENKITSKSKKITFFNLNEKMSFSKIVNLAVIDFLLNKNYNYFTIIDIENNYDKNFLKSLISNNRYFSYSNYSVNDTMITKQYDSYDEFCEYTNNYKGFESFMWHKNAVKEIGLFMEYDEEDSKIDYLLRTFKNVEKCTFTQDILVSSTKYIFNINANLLNQQLTDLYELSIIITCLETNSESLLNCLTTLNSNTSTQKTEVLLIYSQAQFNIINILDTANYKNIEVKKVFDTSISTYAEALNHGITNSSGKYIGFIKEHIIVNKDWDKKLITSLEASDCLAIMPITNNKGCIDIAVSSSNECFEKYEIIKDNIHFEKNTDLQLYCTIINKSDLKKMGLFDTIYINGFEEIDYNQKIKLFQKNILLTSDTVVYSDTTYVKDDANSKEIFEMNANMFKTKWNINENYIKQFDNAKKSMPVYITNKENGLTSYFGINNTKDFLNYQFKKHNFTISDSYYNKKLNHYNDINIDFDLYAYLHMNLQNTNKDIYDHIVEKGIRNGHIYSIDQLKNAFDYEDFFTSNGKYYVKHKDLYVDVKFLVKNIYKKPYSYFINDIEVLSYGKEINLSLTCNFDVIITCFIGDYKIGLFIINKLLNSGKSNYPILFIFKNTSDYEQLKIIITLFRKRIVFKSREYGNDIIPTLQAVNYCLSKNITSKYIYKLHTKSDVTWFETASNYLLHKPEKELISILEEKILNKECNCISDEKYYVDVKNEDQFCKDLINKYANTDLYTKTHFVAGSMFFTKMDTFESVLKFIEENDFRGYFMNNLYDSNIVFVSNSPVHYLERLFGIISLK